MSAIKKHVKSLQYFLQISRRRKKHNWILFLTYFIVNFFFDLPFCHRYSVKTEKLARSNRKNIDKWFLLRFFWRNQSKVNSKFLEGNRIELTLKITYLLQVQSNIHIKRGLTTSKCTFLYLIFFSFPFLTTNRYNDLFAFISLKWFSSLNIGVQTLLRFCETKSKKGYQFSLVYSFLCMHIHFFH